MSWEDVAFVVKSSQRKAIIMFLQTPKTPSQISKHLQASLSNTSLKLSDLRKKGLIECINPNDRKGRIYRLTKRGEESIRKIKEMG